MAEGIHFTEARGADGMRIYAIGDVHGRLDLLLQMHDRIADEIRRDRPDNWRIIHLGDYVDRGPDSRGVLDFLVSASQRDRRLITLTGNHDIGFLEFIAEPDPRSLFVRFGGRETALSYGVAIDISSDSALKRSHANLLQAVPESHLDFLRTRQFAVSTGDFFFCHAGIRPQVSLDRQSPEDLIWIRGDFLDYSRLHPKIIVHGHTISATPEILPNRVNVDTGAYRSGELTAFVVDGAVKRVISVLARPSEA